jgi:hypothetical protein
MICKNCPPSQTHRPTHSDTGILVWGRVDLMRGSSVEECSPAGLKFNPVVLEVQHSYTLLWETDLNICLRMLAQLNLSLAYSFKKIIL